MMLLPKQTAFFLFLFSVTASSLYPQERSDIQYIINSYEEKLLSNPDDVRLLYALGQAYYSQGEYQSAERLFLKGMRLSPHDLRFQISLGLVYLFTNKLTKSEALLEKAVRHDPQNPDILSALGKIHQKNYQLDEAEKYYLEALKADTGNLATLTFLGSLRLQQHRYSEAQELFEKVLRRHPDNPWVKDDLLRASLGPELYAIKQAVAAGELNEAVQSLQKLLSSHRTFLDLYLHLGDVYVQMRQNQKAIQLYHIALSLHLEESPLLAAIGNAYLADKDYQQAEEYFRESLKLEPENTEALAGLGRIYALTGAPGRALIFYHEALSIRPYGLTALNYYSELMMKQKSYEEAIEAYRKILRIEPRKTWVQKAILEAKHGELLDKIEHKKKRREFTVVESLYRKLIKKAPDNPDFYDKYASFLYDRHKFEKAIQVYLKGLQTEHNSVPLRIGLGFAYLKNKEIHSSGHYFREALQLDPDNPEALAGIGAIAAYDDNYEQAETFYLDALEKDSQNITALMLLGNIRMEQHRYKEARRLFERVRSLNPEVEGIDRAILDSRHGPVLKQIEKSRQEDDFITAESLYLQLINEAPRIQDYYLELGNFYMRHNYPNRAASIYQDYLDVSPDSPEILTSLGYARLEEGYLEKADQLFSSVLAVRPESSEALAGLGVIAKQKGEFESAEKLLKKAVRYDPENITALTALGALYENEKKLEAAEEVYRKLELLLPEQQWIRYTLQNIRFAPVLKQIAILEDANGVSDKEKTKNQLLAEKLYTRLLRDAPGNPHYHLQLGLLLAEMKRFSEAIEVYRRGAVLAPDSEDLRVAMGFSYLYLENLEQAKEAFLAVYELNPSNADALAGLGRVAELQGDLDEAANYYRRALDFEPDNIDALSFMGAFKIKMDDYKDARKIYERILQVKPDYKWAAAALDDIEAAPLLQKIREHEESGQIDEAAELYFRLISRGKDDEEYYLGLGNLYVRAKRYNEAAQTFEKGIDKNPDSYKLLAAAGVAHVLNEESEQALKLLEQAYLENSEDASVLAGLGRVAFLNENFEQSEDYYRKALAYGPDNTAALSFYGELLMKKKRYEEAAAVYGRLIELDPDADWARNARKRAEDGYIVDGAAVLVDLGELDAAADEYLSLIGRSGENAEYYLYLGDTFVSMGRLEDAVWTYRIGLEANPESEVLWRAVGFAMLQMDRTYCAIRIFNCLLSHNPDDADSWAGLGRAFALQGCYYASLAYYCHALGLEPDNETALTFMATGEEEHGHIYSAKILYSRLSRIRPRKRWIRNRWAANHKKTRPQLTIRGGYYEENEWDDTIDEWVARYQVYGGEAGLSRQVSDRLTVASYAGEDFYKLRDTEDDFTIYHFGVTRSRFETLWMLSPQVLMDLRLGLSYYAPVDNGSFTQESGFTLEPTLLLTWRCPSTETTFGLSSQTDLVARNFTENKAEMVTSYYALGRWEHELIEKLSFGLEGSYHYLDGFTDNRFQRALAWTSWSPEVFYDWITFNYFFQYQNFSRVIPDYYTYAPQLVNHLQVTLNRTWDDLGFLEIGYAHGWQQARTRFAQIIVNQPPIQGDMFWDRREYNTCFIRAAYDQCPLRVELDSSFYRDTEKYTIWSVDLELGWRF